MEVYHSKQSAMDKSNNCNVYQTMSGYCSWIGWVILLWMEMIHLWFAESKNFGWLSQWKINYLGFSGVSCSNCKLVAICFKWRWPTLSLRAKHMAMKLDFLRPGKRATWRLKHTNIKLYLCTYLTECQLMCHVQSRVERLQLMYLYWSWWKQISNRHVEWFIEPLYGVTVIWVMVYDSSTHIIPYPGRFISNPYVGHASYFFVADAPWGHTWSDSLRLPRGLFQLEGAFGSQGEIPFGKRLHSYWSEFYKGKTQQFEWSFFNGNSHWNWFTHKRWLYIYNFHS